MLFEVSMKTRKRLIGDKGEEVACKLLRSNSYSILARNFSSKTGEIDIIALDLRRNEIVFVEVKTRSSIEYGYPYEFVDHNKKRRMVTTASYYLKLTNLRGLQPRFDIIEVINTKKGIYARHLVNVFEL